MNNEKAFLVVDIGSIKVTAVIGVNSNNYNDFPKIYGHGIADSEGLKKGIITNIQEASKSIKKAVNNAIRIAGMSVNQATVSIASSYTKGVTSHGIVNVIDGEISINEIKRAIDTALYNSDVMLNEHKVIHVLPYMFKVDEHDGIEDPLGMNGSRLEAFVYIVTVQKSSLNNLEKVIKNAGISVKNFVLDGYATSISVVNKDEKNLGVASINLGGSICNLTISLGNTICYNNVLPVGSFNITKDISITAQTNLKSAELAKINYANLALDDNDKIIQLPTLGDSSKHHNISISIINQIIHARVEEILLLLKDMLKKSGYQDEIGAGIVLTGGMSKMKGMQDIASKIFDSHPSRIAKPYAEVLDELGDQSYSTVIGLLLYASGRYTRYEIDSNKILRYLKTTMSNIHENTELRQEVKNTVDMHNVPQPKDDLPQDNLLQNDLKLNNMSNNSKLSNWLKDLF